MSLDVRANTSRTKEKIFGMVFFLDILGTKSIRFIIKGKHIELEAGNVSET